MATRSENLQGAALMSGAMACYTINDAFLKVLSDDVPFFQLLFLRGVATTVLMFVIAKALGMFDLRMTRRSRHFEQMSDADVIRQIAQDHGLSAEVDVPGSAHTVLAQVNQSDLAFLRERARAAGVELWVEDTRLRAAAGS